MMKQFAHCGYMCAPIVDPEHRYHTKRDSAHRRSEKIFNFSESASARHELIQVTQRLNESNDDNSNTVNLQKDREYLTKIANKHNGLNRDSSDTIKFTDENTNKSNLYLPNDTSGCM